MAIGEITTEIRTCRGCGRELTLASFRRKRRSGERREYTCSDCHRQRMKQWRQERRGRRIDRFARSAHYQRLDRRLRAFTCAMIRRLGGVERAADLWVDSIRQAKRDRPGCPFLLASLTSLGRLIEFCESRGAETPDTPARLLTDEELHDRLFSDVAALIRTQPELVLWAAAECGWQVTPPTVPTADGSP